MAAIAVVGTGFIGPVHVEALRRLQLPVKGILGSTQEKSRHAAQALGLEKGYESYESVIADDDVTAIHIATPNETHVEMVRLALEANKHVVCEKPLALDTRETSELLRLSRQKPQLVTAVNYNCRFYPLVLHVREMVRNGEIGEIYFTHGRYCQDWLLFESDWNWRLEPERGGKLRAVGDIGTHWMDLVGFVTDRRVEAVMADLKTFVPKRNMPQGNVETFMSGDHTGGWEHDYKTVSITTEDWGTILFHYEGGSRGVLTVSQVSAGRKNQLAFEIAGSKGAVAWDSERPNELWLGHRERPNELLLKDPTLLAPQIRPYINYPGGHTEGFPDTFKQLYRAIYDYIKQENFEAPRPFPTFEDGHYEVVLCEKILASHEDRRWIDVGSPEGGSL